MMIIIAAMPPAQAAAAESDVTLALPLSKYISRKIWISSVNTTMMKDA